MDVLDAGVYVAKFEARVPRHAKLTLWGPLQAREMGFAGWEFQDGGETGFVAHNAGTKLSMGYATSTLIFVRRLERAFLTVYFGGYPADAPAGQRKLDWQKSVAACEAFLTRLAKEPVHFARQAELALVDNVNGDAADGDGVDDVAFTRAPATRKSAAAPAAKAATAGTRKRAAPAPGQTAEPTHVDGAPSWARLPPDVSADRLPQKGKANRSTGEVWEV